MKTYIDYRLDCFRQVSEPDGELVERRSKERVNNTEDLFGMGGKNISPVPAGFAPRHHPRIVETPSRRRLGMKRTVGLFVIGVIAVFAMVGCGGGGGAAESAPPATTSSQSLQGTYSFVGFDVNYSNGTTIVNINENSPAITSWSGTMEFGTDTLSQSFFIDNTPIALTGNVTITWITANVTGIAHVTDKSGTHDISFTISGNNLTTYSGVIQYGSPGLTVEEYNYWTKVSDSISPVRKASVTEKSDEPAYTGKHWIAELLVQ